MSEILDSSGAPIKKEEKLPNRAERKRMLKDPLGQAKFIAGSEGINEYDRLIAYGQIVIHRMSEIQALMAGLMMYPKNLRVSRQEELVSEWNELAQKIEETQVRMDELNPPKKPVSKKSPIEQ